MNKRSPKIEDRGTPDVSWNLSETEASKMINLDKLKKKTIGKPLKLYRHSTISQHQRLLQDQYKPCLLTNPGSCFYALCPRTVIQLAV